MRKFAVIMLTLIGLFIGNVIAEEVPQLPASYWGEILTENNQTLNGILVAKIDGEERGSIEVINNKFGGESFTDKKLLVEGTIFDEGKQVEFYLDGVKLNTVYPIYWHSGDVREITLLYGNITIPNKPPKADFNYTIVGDVEDGKKVEFKDLSTDDGEVTKWFWDFGDGTTSTERNPIHVYKKSGNYTVSLTVWDDKNASNTVKKIIEIKNKPPVVDFTYEIDGLVVNFKANCSDDGIIVKYIWNFGDGFVKEGEEITHSYPDEGTYNVTLTVIDNLGEESSISKIITVKRPIDFEVSDIIAPSSLLVGNEYTLYAKVDYKTKSAPKTVDVGLYVNGTLNETINFTLYPGVNYIPFKWKPESGGKYNITVVVDLSNNVAEIDETNNIKSRILEVSTPNYGFYRIHVGSAVIGKSSVITLVFKVENSRGAYVPVIVKAN